MNKYRLEEYKEEYFNILYEMKKIILMVCREIVWLG